MHSESMTFVTGDVHHMSMGGNDQNRLPCTEVEAAIKYADLALKHGVRVTLFLTGRSCYEEKEGAKALSCFQNVEVGGHTWNAFRFKAFHKLSEVAFGSYFGPKRYQEWEVRKTIDSVEGVSGRKCVSWRGHCYKEDASNNAILLKHGIKVVSSTRDRKGLIKRDRGGLLCLPINTLTDELNIERLGRTKRDLSSQLIFMKDEDGIPVYHNSRYSKRKIGSWIVGGVNRFAGTKRVLPERRFLTIEQWCNRLRKDVEANLQSYGYATIQAHPAIMHVADRFESFEMLCRWIGKRHKTYFVKELLDCHSETISRSKSA